MTKQTKYPNEQINYVKREWLLKTNFVENQTFLNKINIKLTTWIWKYYH